MQKTLFAALVAAIPNVAFADNLTFNVALERAAAEAPSLRGRAAGVAAAQSAAIAADRQPDPTLDVGVQDFPVTGPDAGRLNRDNFTMQKIGISQQFVNPAKRHARAARASAEIGIAEAGALVEGRLVRLQTALAWVDLYYAQRRLAQLALLDGSLHDLQATVSARLASGSARPSQALEPDQLRAQVNDRRAELIAEVAKARASLARFTGDPNPEVAGTPPELRVDRTRLIAGLATLPSLRAMDVQSVAADSNIRLARAEKRPDWKVSASYGRREPNYGDLVSVGVSIDLPFFAKRRQDPKIAAAASEAERARYDRIASEREVVASLDSDLADHLMHHQRLENARRTLVPLASKRAILDRDSYAAGKLDLGSALLSSLAFAEAEIDALAREAEVARDAIRINITYGEDSQ
jgi:cobalt-zinc-cadmium efflux system outer membrane protein